MARWMRWHCPPDTEVKIWAMAVWNRARYLSVTEAPHITSERGETFRFFATCMPEQGSNPWSPTLQAGSFNHCTRAPANCHRLPSNAILPYIVKTVSKNVIETSWGVETLKSSLLYIIICQLLRLGGRGGSIGGGVGGHRSHVTPLQFISAPFEI